MVVQPKMQRGISCRKCRYFYVTYEVRQPNGCRAYGFKSRQMPAYVVLLSSGEPCNLFAVRETKK